MIAAMHEDDSPELAEVARIFREVLEVNATIRLIVPCFLR